VHLGTKLNKEPVYVSRSMQGICNCGCGQILKTEPSYMLKGGHTNQHTYKVAVLLVNGDEVAIVKQKAFREKGVWRSGMFGPCKGSVDPPKHDMNAAAQELYEEMGIRACAVMLETCTMIKHKKMKMYIWHTERLPLKPIDRGEIEYATWIKIADVTRALDAGDVGVRVAGIRDLVVFSRNCRDMMRAAIEQIQQNTTVCILSTIDQSQQASFDASSLMHSMHQTSHGLDAVDRSSLRDSLPSPQLTEPALVSMYPYSNDRVMRS